MAKRKRVRVGAVVVAQFVEKRVKHVSKMVAGLLLLLLLPSIPIPTPYGEQSVVLSYGIAYIWALAFFW